MLEAVLALWSARARSYANRGDATLREGSAGSAQRNRQVCDDLGGALRVRKEALEETVARLGDLVREHCADRMTRSCERYRVADLECGAGRCPARVMAARAASTQSTLTTRWERDVERYEHTRT